MGNSISSWGGPKKVQGIINKAGLPLQVDESNPQEDSKAPLSPFTEAYPAEGWFTGVRSQVTVPKPASVVYESLSKDLHKVFTPMTECVDEIEEDNGKGYQAIFRIVRIPFKVAFVTGNLKLRLHVKQDSKTGKISFESAKEGRLITKFTADFHLSPKEGSEEHTVVKLDAKVNAQSLPPPPFKGMVKDVMVRKMDSCMVDLVAFHSRTAGSHEVEVDARKDSLSSAKSGQLGNKNGLLAGIRRSLGRRPSLESKGSARRSRSLDWRRSFSFSARKSASRRHDGASETAKPSGQASVFSDWQKANGVGA